MPSSRHQPLRYAVVNGIEIFAPAAVSEFEIVRAADESDEEFEAAREMYRRLFRAIK